MDRIESYSAACWTLMTRQEHLTTSGGSDARVEGLTLAGPEGALRLMESTIAPMVGMIIPLSAN